MVTGGKWRHLVYTQTNSLIGLELVCLAVFAQTGFTVFPCMACLSRESQSKNTDWSRPPGMETVKRIRALAAPYIMSMHYCIWVGPVVQANSVHHRRVPIRVSVVVDEPYNLIVRTSPLLSSSPEHFVFDEFWYRVLWPDKQTTRCI